jgi:NAD(P)-dependent dehydrogenase (short-subunit alcohol dehydrogenase family)
MNRRMDLTGARVWITGASSGIGEAIIGPLVGRGARIAISARRAERLAAIAGEWQALGKDVRAFPLDVTDPAAVHRAVQDIEAALGGIDLAIFNAGGHLPGRPRQFDPQQYADIMTLNFLGVVYGIDAVLPGMLARGKGHIAGVASVAGYRGIPAAGAYGASKAALIHMLESIRFDLEPKGIAVTVVTPGFVKTPLTDRNRFPMPFLMPVDRAAEALVAGLEQGRREIHFPKIFTWTLKLLRILPYPLYQWIMWRATKGRRLAKDAALRAP